MTASRWSAICIVVSFYFVGCGQEAPKDDVSKKGAVPATAASTEAEADDDAAPPAAAKDVEVITNSLGMKFAVIPAGEFTMGARESDAAAFKPEKPAHKVKLSKSFAIGQYEVTKGQFAAFVDDQKFKTESKTDGDGAFA